MWCLDILVEDSLTRSGLGRQERNVLALDDSGETAIAMDLMVIVMVDLLRKTRVGIEEMPDEKVEYIKRRGWALACFPFGVFCFFIVGIMSSADFIQSHFGIQVPLAIAISLLILVPLSRPSIVESFRIYGAFNRRLNALKREQAVDRNPFGI